MQPCFYAKRGECEGIGQHQCPKCKEWYCEECYEMFLPIDPRFWTETALICPQCHYGTHGVRLFESQEGRDHVS